MWIMLWECFIAQIYDFDVTFWSEDLNQSGVGVLLNCPQADRPVDGVEEGKDHREEDDEFSVNLLKVKTKEGLLGGYDHAVTDSCEL